VAVAIAAVVVALVFGACSGSGSGSSATTTTARSVGTTPPPPSGVVLQVDDWQLTQATFDNWRTQIAANPLYLGSWQAANGTPPTVEGSGELSPELVASLLNEQLSFRVAAQQLAARGGAVTDANRAEATRRLGEGVAAGAGAEPGTADAPTVEEAQRLGEQLLAGFGSYGPVLRDGVASLIALRDNIGGGDREAALRRLYDQNRPDLTEVCAAHVLVATAPTGGAGTASPGTTSAPRDAAAARARATEARAELDAGVPFADVVREYSDDPGTVERGGDLGCTSVGQYQQAFADAVRAAPIGEVVGPVTTPFGQHLIVVRSRTEPTFEAIRDRLARAYDQSGSDALVEVLERSLRNAQVLVDSRYGLWDGGRASIVAPGTTGEGPRLELSPAPEGSVPGGPGPSTPTTGAVVPTSP
jgi:parvulin-like peptidyl-prolyl isomerase